MKKRQRPNYLENRYNQWVLAGKIAVKIGDINPYNDDGSIPSLYQINDNELHYSVIGQDYLRQMEINITDF